MQHQISSRGKANQFQMAAKFCEQVLGNVIKEAKGQ